MTAKQLQRIALLMTLALTATAAWAGAGSTTIEDAYQSALDTNEYMKIAEEGVVQSDSRVDQAWSSPR